MSLFQEACKYIPGGVNSPVRAFRGVGGEPIFFKKAAGAYVDRGRRPALHRLRRLLGSDDLGPRAPAGDRGRAARSPPTACPSARRPSSKRSSRAASSNSCPSIELVRFVSSGTEATMSAIRLARGFTGRDTIVKFEGCYHGHSDSLLIKAGSGALTLGVPTSPGVPKALADHTVTLNYNDADQVREVFRQIGAQVACVIVEPVAGNMNCVPPGAGFLADPAPRMRPQPAHC